MTVYFIQIATVIFIAARMMIILTLGSAADFGLLSIVVALITLLTIPVQFCNNQGVQVALLNDTDVGRQVVVNTIVKFGLVFSVLVLLLVVLLGKYYSSLNDICDFSTWGVAVVLAVFVTFMSSAYDVKSLSKGYLKLYYSALSVNALAGCISSCMILIFGNGSLIVFVPFISSSVGLVFYFIASNRLYHEQLIGLNFDCNFNLLYKLFRETWSLNFIPLFNSIADFLVRSVALVSIGAGGVGHYQTIVSIESMLGNLFLGTYYKRLMLANYKKISFSAADLRKIAKDTLLFSLFSIVGIVLLYCLNGYFNFKHEIFKILAPLLFVCIFRSAWYVWGAVGQLLIIRGFVHFVSIVEVLTKTMVSLLLILILLYSDSRLYAYVYSLAITSIALIYIVSYSAKRALLMPRTVECNCDGPVRGSTKFREAD